MAGRRGVLRSLALVFRRYHEDGGMYMAAAISYYALMSLIPLLFVLINLFGYFLGRSPDLHGAVLRYVKAIYPMAGEALGREITRVVEHSGLGWLSLVVFLWLGSMVFHSLAHHINAIFKSERRRRFFSATVLSFVMVLLSGTFMVASFWIAYIPKIIGRHPEMVAGSKTAIFLMNSVFLQVLPFALNFLSFTFIYKLLPKRKVPLRLAARGGLAAAALWEASKLGFAWFVGNVSDIGGVYGQFSAIIMFLLWIYYSSAILLLVAEMVHLAEQGEIA